MESISNLLTIIDDIRVSNYNLFMCKEIIELIQLMDESGSINSDIYMSMLGVLTPISSLSIHKISKLKNGLSSIYVPHLASNDILRCLSSDDMLPPQEYVNLLTLDMHDSLSPASWNKLVGIISNRILRSIYGYWSATYPDSIIRNHIGALTKMEHSFCDRHGVSRPMLPLTFSIYGLDMAEQFKDDNVHKYLIRSMVSMCYVRSIEFLTILSTYYSTVSILCMSELVHHPTTPPAPPVSTPPICLAPHPLLEVAPKSKKAIPLMLKRHVWNRYIGEIVGNSPCYCCRITQISQMSFHCGHVVAEHNGGKLMVDNLRPICQSCNSSMRTMNMFEYMDMCGFGPPQFSPAWGGEQTDK
jgi:hypothetical protein